MSDRILHKRSLTEGSIPTTASLENGELAINVADGKIYLKKSGSVGESIESAISTNSSAVGDITITGSLFVSASQPVSINGQLNVNGVTSSLHGTADTASYIEWNNIDNKPIFTSQSIFNDYTASSNLRFQSLEFESGSIRNELNNYTASTDNRLGNIESTTASLNNTIDVLQVFTSSANLRLTQLEVESGSIRSTLNQYSSSTNLRLTDLEFESASIRNTLNQYSQSNNLRVQSLEVESGSVRGRLSNIESFSSSQLILNPTFATTGSNTFKGSQGISGSLAITGSLDVYNNSKFGHIGSNTHQFTGSVSISGSLRANGLLYPLQDNGEFSFFQSDGLGNVTLQYVNTLYETVYNGETTQILKGTPLYVSGSQGAASRVFRADASNPLKMPVIYIAADNIDPATEGRGAVLGLISGVNTTGYSPGTEVYVGVGGGWTSTRPTGSIIVQTLGIITKEGVGGQGVILNPGPNNIPNLKEGNFWVGDYRWQAVYIPTASFESTASFNQYTSSVNSRFLHLETESGSIRSTLNQYTQSTDLRLNNIETDTSSYARIDTNNTFVGLQTFNNISVDGTASFAYIQSTTGSAKLIGDAFIVLNNNTPAQRYAGLIVIDSGSMPSTSSFYFDGQLNNWGYEYSGSGGVDYGVAIFGPEYSVKDSPIYLTDNRIPKAVDNHHLNDSNISDDGVKVQITIPLDVTTSITGSTIKAISGFQGNLTGTADTASYVEWNNIGNRPTLVSQSAFTTYQTQTDNRLNYIEIATSSINLSLSNIKSFTESIDLRVDNLELESGSVRNRLSRIELFTSSQESVNLTLQSYTESINTKFNTLATYTGSNDTLNATQNSRLDQLSTESSSVIIRLNNIEFFSSSQNTKNNTLETYTASLDNKFNTLGLYTASIDTKFNDLSIYTSSNDTLNTTQNNRLDLLSTFTSSANIRLNNIEAFTSSIDTTIKTKLDVDGVISGSSQLTQSYDLRYELQGREILSGSVLNYIPVIVSQSSQIQINDVTGFNTYSQSVDSRLDSFELESGSIRNELNSYTSSANNRLSNLEVTSASVNSSISNLNVFTSSYNTGSFSGSFVGDGSGIVNVTFDIAGNTTYSLPFTSSTSITVNHLLNSAYPLVQVYDNNDEQVLPTTIKVLNSSSIQVDFNESVTGNIVVAKAGHIITGSSLNTSNLNGQPGSYYLDWNNFTNVPTTYYKEAVSGSSTYSINHNLNEDLPIVQVYDTNKEQVIPFKIQSITQNQVYVEFTNIFSGSIIVKV